MGQTRYASRLEKPPTSICESRPVPNRHPPNCSAEYRSRAEEARQQAAAAPDEETRKKLLQTADTWDRMAAYEDKHNPARPGAS
jgi:hypothetical protein